VGGNCPGGGNDRGEYVRGENIQGGMSSTRPVALGCLLPMPAADVDVGVDGI